MSKQPRSPDDLADVIRNGNAPKRVPVEKNFQMRIGRDGTWYYQGTPIKRIELVKLFSTVLKRDSEGGFWLETPVERGRIEVEDAPFTAVEVQAETAEGTQTLRFRTNLDAEVVAGPEHPIRVEIDSETGEPSPYILVRDGLEALILRPVFYELVDLAEEVRRDGDSVLGVRSGDSFFTLGKAA
ncbi:MAG: DUF1285 domain-containing protein [Alphaproteobacteria bacterium]